MAVGNNVAMIYDLSDLSVYDFLHLFKHKLKNENTINIPQGGFCFFFFKFYSDIER